jgi:hypothetical protein
LSETPDAAPSSTEDRAPMPKMLEQIEIDLIGGLLEVELNPVDNWRHWLFTVTQDADVMRDLKWSDKLGIVVESAVHLCDQAGWRHNPPLLLRLVDALPPTRELEPIKRKLAARPVKSTRDPFTSRLLINRLPLLNRNDFRAAVRKLVPSHGKSILTVNGPRKCGKSYTSQYVQHLSEHLTGHDERFRFIRVPLEEGIGSTYTPDDLAGDIVARMERSPNTIPDRQEPMNRWVNCLTNWVLTEAAATGHRWWWILDGFCATDLNLDTRKFVQAMVTRIIDGQHARRVRLILVDYPEPLPKDVRLRALNEPLSSASSISTQDVREVFVELNDDESLGLSDAQIDEITSGIFKDLTEAEEHRLEELRERINGKIDALTR